MADKETNVQVGFTGGEVTPYMQGRVDNQKVRLGANVMRNFMADYRGGVVSRPGTSFVGLVPKS